MLLRVCQSALILGAILALPALQSQAQPEKKTDWSHQVKLPAGEESIDLFNGKDLTGWKGFSKYFSVVDGMIRARNDEPVKTSTFLFTETEFRNYRLLLEVKQTMGEEYSTMHSAVASGGKQVKNLGGEYGFEGPILMFCHDWGIWGADGRQRVFPADQKKTMADMPWEKKGQWNQLEFLVVGNRIRMVANGQLIVDHTEDEGRLKKCALGLQMHNEKRTQEFFFRGLVAVDNPTNAMLTQTGSALPTAKATLLESERIVFLGDSNTDNGEFIVQLEAAILEAYGAAPEMINLGLASETCSGDSEPIHPFPRPNVHERLDRVLEKSKADVVLACYGMNDGIYHPFDKTRFKSYQDGIKTIIQKVNAADAKLILLTPPPFDPLPGRTKGKLRAADAKKFSWKTIYENYDSEVIKVYADWVLQQQPHVLGVVDVHTHVKKFLANKRTADPKFTFSKDGVHFNDTGHRVFAQAILDSLSKVGIEAKLSSNDQLLELVRKRQAISHLAWLSEVKHLRPGVKKGLPLSEAEKKIKPISKEIGALLNK